MIRLAQASVTSRGVTRGQPPTNTAVAWGAMAVWAKPLQEDALVPD